MNPNRPQADFADYDTNPDRFRTGSEAPRKYGQGDVHELVAERIVNERLHPVLDLGCGEGRLCRLLQEQNVEVVGLDRSPTMLSSAPGSRVLADASHLPFRRDSFGAVVALYMLYHLPEPETALRESRRVLRRGGLFAAAAPSRRTDPEIAEVLPTQVSTFDAEVAPDLVAEFFTKLEVVTWDAPFVHLPSVEAVAEYLFGRGMEKGKCEKAARRLGAPLDVTKRGCLVWGYKDG